MPGDAPLVLALTSGGILAEGSVARLPDSPAPYAVKASVAAVQPLPGGGAVIALNRVGLARIDCAAEAARGWVVRFLPLRGSEEEFSGRTVGTSWSSGGESVFFLYRHPIFETEAPRAPQFAFVASDGTVSGRWAARPKAFGDRYLFAVYPRPGGLLYLQSRKDSAEGVESYYGAWSYASKAEDSMSRSGFEAKVGPRPHTAAPAALKACVDSLDGSVVVDARLADGSRAAYLKGTLDAAVEAWGHESPFGTLVLARDGRAAFIGPAGGPARLTYLDPPAPGAAFRDAALVDGLIVAVWQEDLFPDSGRSGLVVLDPGL